MMNRLYKKSDEELIVNKENVYESLKAIEQFQDYFTSLDKWTKKEVVDKFQTYDPLNGDWRGHALKSAKKSEIPTVVKNIYTRTKESCLESIRKIDDELQDRENKRIEIKARRKREEWLHGLVDKWEEKNECICGSDIDGIRFLIDDGTIIDEKELAEYGVH